MLALFIEYQQSNRCFKGRGSLVPHGCVLSPKELDLRVVVAIRCRSKTVLVTFRCGNVSSLKQLYERSAILKVCAKWREDFWVFLVLDPYAFLFVHMSK